MFIKEWSLNFIYHLSVNLMQPSQNNKAKKFKPNLFWKLLVMGKIHIYVNLFKICKPRNCIKVKEKNRVWIHTHERTHTWV